MENDGCVSHLTLYASTESGDDGGVSPPGHSLGRTLKPLTSNSAADQARRSRSAVPESDAVESDTSVKYPGGIPDGIAYGGVVEIAFEYPSPYAETLT